MGGHGPIAYRNQKWIRKIFRAQSEKAGSRTEPYLILDNHFQKYNANKSVEGSLVSPGT